MVPGLRSRLALALPLPETEPVDAEDGHRAQRDQQDLGKVHRADRGQCSCHRAAADPAGRGMQVDACRPAGPLPGAPTSHCGGPKTVTPTDYSHTDYWQHRDSMKDTTIKKVSSSHSPVGELGQRYLVSGKRVSMRLWSEEPNEEPTRHTSRDYETVGFVVSGSAELTSEDQVVRLDAGDSWLVPAGASHSYRVLESFTAIEATSPPAQVHGRDEDE